MPYADPDQRKEASRLRAAKSRLNRKQARLRGEAPDPTLPPSASPEAPPVAKTGKKSGKPAAVPAKKSTSAPAGCAPAPTIADLAAVAIPQMDEWHRRKVQLGLWWLQHAEPIMERMPVSAFQLGKAGVDLVNANLSLLPELREDGANPGSVAVVDERLLEHDPEYRRLAEALLVRKMELQLSAAATS